MAANTVNLISSLKGDNYSIWKLQCQMVLMKDALWGIVNGTEVAPAEAEPLAKFNTRRDKALAIIVLSVDPTLLYLVGDPTNPIKVWKTSFKRSTWERSCTPCD